MLDWNRAGAEAATLAGGWAEARGPGGAIVLFDAGGPRAAAAGGFASIEHEVPFTADTVTRYASISKQFAAATLLLEALPLEAPLGALLQGLPSALAGIPLARALDMTAALPDLMETLWQIGVPFTASLGAAELHALLRRLPGPNAVPGTEMAYSNTGWRLAQSVFLPQRGIDYAEALRRRLLAPLNLPIRLVADEAEALSGLATGYWHDGTAWQRGRYGLHFSASGGLAGSAASLARWGAFLLAGRGPLDGVLAQLAAPRFFADGSANAYGLGLMHVPLGGLDLVGHGGSLPGYRNHLLMAPELDAGVVILTNREDEALWPALRILASLVGAALPEPTANLPNGLFATAEGPFWADLAAGSLSYMGGHEPLVAIPGGARSLPTYLEAKLHPRPDGAIAAWIGGVDRLLEPVPEGLALDPALAGTWREARFGSVLTIHPDGTALWPWAGGLGRDTQLTPLPGGRALATLAHGPWRHRPCLCLQADGSLRIASHRARMLHFTRI
jgi:CubicO group peptidase (beta-lactamase class C family)